MTDKGDTVLDVSLRFPITFTAIVVAAVAVLTAAFYFATGSFTDTVIFLAAAAAAGGTITTAFYVARTLNLYIRQESRRRDREEALDERGKKERALRYGERWNDPSLFYVRDVCRALFELRGKPQDEIIKLAEEKKTNIIHLLNFLEEISFAIDRNLVDIDLVRGQFEGIVHSVWQLLLPWVTKFRTDQNRSKIWERLEALEKVWK